MATELSDADVMAPPPQAAAPELNDEDVMKPAAPKAAGGPSPFNFAQQPLNVGFALARGYLREIGQAHQSMLDFLMTPGTTVKKGLTSEQEIGFAANAALMDVMGKVTGGPSGNQFIEPRPELAKIAGPAIQEFQDTVIDPGLAKTANDVLAKPVEAPAEGQPTPHPLQALYDHLNQMQEAKDLGIFDDKPPTEPTIEDSPAKLAQDAVPQPLGAAATPEGMRGNMGHEPGAYDARGKEWIEKIDAPEDARDAIESIARQYDYFPESRAGEASPASRAAVAEAAGIDPKEMDSGYFNDHFGSPNKVRAVIQALRQTTRDFMEASETARKAPTDENMAAALEAQERQRYVLEYTMGARAESGRGLNAWKEALRETERSRASVGIKAGEETGSVPKGVSDVVDAANDVQANLKTPGAKLGLQKLIDAAEKLVNPTEEATTGKPKASLPPDLAGLVDQARDTLAKLKGDKTPAQFQKLIDVAERQAVNMVKQGTVKNPVEALPPELQALVDKTERIVDRFGSLAKGEKAAMLLARAGRTAAEQAEIVRGVEGLTPNQVANVLNRLRTDNRPGWVFWSIQQALISGLITHTKYAIVNAASTIFDRVIAPEVSAIVGKMRGEEVSLMAPLHAIPELFRAVPDAWAGVTQAFKTGARVPLESELKLATRGEQSPQAAGAQVPYGTQQGPNWGIWRKVFNDNQLSKATTVIGTPGRSANAFHTFFKILNERAAAGSRAFEKVVAEGEKIGTDKFNERYQYHLDNPTDEVLRQNVDDAYSGTFMEKLGDQTQAFAHLVRNTPFKWLVFFTHIPMNMIRKGVEYSPLAVLNTMSEMSTMGKAIRGELGTPAQNLAVSKVAIGTAIGGYFVTKALAGQATGDYPTDPKERLRWNMMGIQPNSIQVNGEWTSLERLGPQAMVARLAANYAAVIRHYKDSDEETSKKLTEAGLALVLGTGNVLASDVGFETIKNIINVMENPKESARFAAWQLSSYMMPISFITQFASFHDPFMRVADNLLDGLKYHIPIVRETLAPKRDPVYGEPIHNPGESALLRGSPVQSDIPKMEMERLNYFPAPPKSTIGKVKLTPELYDEYEATAGPLVKRLLQNYTQSPGYQTLPDAVKAPEFRALVAVGRSQARLAMFAHHPEIMQQGLEARKTAILGKP